MKPRKNSALLIVVFTRRDIGRFVNCCVLT